MSKGCWFFTLKMLPGTEIFLKGDLSKHLNQACISFYWPSAILCPAPLYPKIE